MPAQHAERASRTRRSPRAFARRFLRRHRRALAAATAGLGVLIALTSLRGAAAPTTSGPAPSDGPDLRSGEVIVPVLLASSAIAGVLSEGDIVDVVGFPEGQATVVAPRVRIIGLPSSGSSFSASSSAVVLVAAPASQALALSAASSEGGVTVTIRRD